jgi:hypothetical protein
MMKIKLLLFVFVLPFVLYSCGNGKKEKTGESEIISTNRTTLNIKGDINNLLQIDSIFTDIKTIPLETNDKCLITEIEKVMFYQEKMLLQDQAQRLFVFNLNGRFLYEVAKLGRGPGELTDLRDFDIDREGNIYILQYKKILKYSIDGKFLQSFPFTFSRTDEIYCNPLEFALKSNGNFYIWGASLGIKSNPEGKLFAMYEMTREGIIVNKYFPLKHIINGEWQNRFRRFENLLIMNPIFGSNTVYSFDSLTVNERYLIDFGKKTLDQPVPEDFTSIRDFRINIDQSYFHSIGKFIEVDDWIFFMFQYQMHVYTVYFSKKLNKSFLSRQWPLVSGRIAPYIISGAYNDSFIAFINPKYVNEQINKCKEVDFNSLPASTKKNMERLEKIKETDNPVMFICSLKKY